MLDGEVVEDPEEEKEDEETGNKTCCGWFNTKVPDTEGDKTDEEFVMSKTDPDTTGEERLNLEGREVTEASDDDDERIR